MFEKLSHSRAKRYVYISFYEVYNDKIYDTFSKLPGKTPLPLNITEDIDGNIEIQDLIRLRITSCSEAFGYLSKALKVFV